MKGDKMKQRTLDLAETVIFEQGESGETSDLFFAAAAYLEENGRTPIATVYGNSNSGGEFHEWLILTVDGF
jgi:hypothetical protein